VRGIKTGAEEEAAGEAHRLGDAEGVVDGFEKNAIDRFVNIGGGSGLEGGIAVLPDR
jgi:hypothetical protein